MWQYLWPLTVCVTENEVPGRFTPPSPPSRFAPIPVCPGSFRPYSRSPWVVSPSFINSAVKNEI